MHDAIGYVMLFHAVAVIELFAVAAFQALRHAPQHSSPINWVAGPLPAQMKPDATWDFAESYDEAA